MKNALPYLLFVVGGMLCGAAQAVYKCTDAKGSVTYQQDPCATGAQTSPSLVVPSGVSTNGNSVTREQQTANSRAMAQQQWQPERARPGYNQRQSPQLAEARRAETRSSVAERADAANARVNDQLCREKRSGCVTEPYSGGSRPPATAGATWGK
jgi:hypothetical protein